MNVLAIGCHPDDVEEFCSGTLIKFMQQGHNVTICHVANGDMGHEIIYPEELRDIRREEAKNAGAMIGVPVISCEIGDLNVYDSQKWQVDLVVDVIRTYQPDVIITHSPTDYMSDHVAVSKLVFAASFAASVPHYVTKCNTPAKITPIYYMENALGFQFTPMEYVDISDVFEKKVEMLECHKSQIKWLRDHDNIDYIDQVRTCARYRGLQCGVQYAEVFSQCTVWPRVVARRLLP